MSSALKSYISRGYHIIFIFFLCLDASGVRVMMLFDWKQATVRAPVVSRHQFFSTSEYYEKAHGSLLSGWMNYNHTACCWFPTSSNIIILPSQFWQIRFESCWLHCSKCRILVLSRYINSYQDTLCAVRNEDQICSTFFTFQGREIFFLWF